MRGEGLELADLVGDVDVFAERHWGRRPLVRSTPSDFAELLDVQGAEQLLLHAARQPTFRLVRGGERLPAPRSTTPVRMGGETLTDVADVAKIAEALGDGATVVLQALQRTWPPLGALCRRLESELSHPVQANAYLTPAHARGLARHADEHDVLVLQSIGTKAWDVDGLGVVQLSPGDVLYLPAGTEHAAESQAAPSLHLTIGILRVTYRQAARRLLDRLDGSALDAPLPIGFASAGSDAPLEDAMARHLRLVTDAIAGTDPAGVAEHERHRARRRRRPGPGRLESILAVADVDPSTVVARYEEGAGELIDVDATDRVALRLADRVIEAPRQGRPALEVLLDGGEVKVGELPGLSDASRLVLVRRLVREGWLQIVRR